MVEQQGTSIWSKFFSAVRRFSFVYFWQGKFNASSRLLYMFVHKAIKYAERFRSPKSSWTEPPQHYTASAFMNGLRKHTFFPLHYSQLICFDCTDNLYPVPSKSCHQLQLMGSAVSNSISWSSSMLNTVWVRHQARRLISVCRCPSRAPS